MFLYLADLMFNANYCFDKSVWKDTEQVCTLEERVLYYISKQYTPPTVTGYICRLGKNVGSN
jgi:hypothetical protein